MRRLAALLFPAAIVFLACASGGSAGAEGTGQAGGAAGAGGGSEGGSSGGTDGSAGTTSGGTSGATSAGGASAGKGGSAAAGGTSSGTGGTSSTGGSSAAAGTSSSKGGTSSSTGGTSSATGGTSSGTGGTTAGASGKGGAAGKAGGTAGTGATTSAGGAGGGGAGSSAAGTGGATSMCPADAHEPNDTQATAFKLPDSTDCDGDGGTFSGVLDGANDQDWYTLHFVDTSLCSVDRSFTITNTVGMKLCVMFKSDAFATNVTCPAGAVEMPFPMGFDGCCTTGKTLDTTYGTTGNNDSSTVMFLMTGLDPTVPCGSYSVSYHF